MIKEPKKILIISGSARKKGNSYKITESFVEKVGDANTYEWEYLYLSDYEIKGCIGCKVCMRKSEEACPFKDDLLQVVSKMKEADGFIFTTPVYSRAVTGQMKTFIDRTNYLLHRPALIGKPTIVISTTDLAGTKKVIDHLKIIITTLGLRYTGGLGVKMGAYINNEKYQQKIEQKLKDLSLVFKTSIDAGDRQAPNFGQVLRFKAWQTRMKISKDKYPTDYEYWAEKGWIEADYFYPTTIKIPVRVLVNLIMKKMNKDMREAFIYK